MVADLVDDDVGHQFLETDPALGPFVEERAAVEVDHRGQLAGQHRALLADRSAAIEPGQVERIFDAELIEHVIGGEFVDLEDDAFDMAAKMLRHSSDRRLGEPLDLGRVGREGLTLAHGEGHNGEARSAPAKPFGPAGEKSMKLSDEQREAALAALPGWSWDPDGGGGGGAIARSFRFRDFAQAFAFMTQIALAAEKADHHPDWSNSWNRVDISLTTHNEGGVTRRDVDLAISIDAIAASLALPETAH